jgi:hypothetical protein
VKSYFKPQTTNSKPQITSSNIVSYITVVKKNTAVLSSAMAGISRLATTFPLSIWELAFGGVNSFFK